MRTSPGNLRFGLLLFLIYLRPCADATDWPYYQHDPARTGRSPAIVNPAELTLAWTAPDGYSTPLIVGDTIYSTRNQGGYTGGGHATLISAFDLLTGAIKWTYSGDFAFPSQAAVGGGLVVFHSGILQSNGGQLYILDALTGALRYTVALTTGQDINVMPLLVPNPSDGTVMAYCVSGQGLCAVQLGTNSGSVLWTQDIGLGDRVMPTLVGNSIVLEGSAFDLATGARNMFHSIGSGGSTTVVYDSARQHIYIWKLEDSTPRVVAYRYSSNEHIDFLWQNLGPGIGNGVSVAIGPSGKVYSVDRTLLIEIDPDTGTTLRSVPGDFNFGLTPAITAGLIWTNSGAQTMAHDLQTLQPVRAFPGANFDYTFTTPGAFSDGYFLLDSGIMGEPGFYVYAAPSAHAMNISTRVDIETGDNVMIGGFIISGTEPKRVLVRALGPSLQQFGISNVLPNPTVDLIGSAGLIIRNDDWRDTQEAQIQATGLQPSNDHEAAVIATLVPGSYTAIVRDANGSPGVGLVEVYDERPTANSKLANISTRGVVEGGDNVMIGGFILGNGNAPARVVVRAIGPSLAQQGISGALQDPVLELRDANGMLIRSNDNWRDSQQADIEASGLAPENDAESAIVATLSASRYTTIVRGHNGTAGVGLVEVYQLH